MTRSAKVKHRMERSRQRAIEYILKALSIGKARKAAWYLCRPDGKMADSDLYDLNPLQ